MLVACNNAVQKMDGSYRSTSLPKTGSCPWGRRLPTKSHKVKLDLDEVLHAVIWDLLCPCAFLLSLSLHGNKTYNRKCCLWIQLQTQQKTQCSA